MDTETLMPNQIRTCTQTQQVQCYLLVLKMLRCSHTFEFTIYHNSYPPTKCFAFFHTKDRAREQKLVRRRNFPASHQFTRSRLFAIVGPFHIYIYRLHKSQLPYPSLYFYTLCCLPVRC